MNVETLLYVIPALGAAGLIYTWLKSAWISRQEVGTERMARIAAAIQQGAMAFLRAEYRVLAIFVLVVAGLLAWSLAIGVAFLSIGVSAWIADQRVGGQLNLRFGSLPPAYHDEYSYLFQAKTFLAGRVSFPSHETVPEIFDQMHVLNEGRFASRYFPGAGAWMAPFVAMGHPYWGQWLAGALCALFIFWAGRELGGNGVGLLAGALSVPIVAFAVAPAWKFLKRISGVRQAEVTDRRAHSI